MNKIFTWKIFLGFGLVLIIGAIIQLIIVYVNDKSFSEFAKSDLQWESFFAILIGIFFTNLGIKKKKKYTQNSN